MGFSHSRFPILMAQVVSSDEAIRERRKGRKPARREMQDYLEVYQIPGLLALQFWGGENLVSVHFASGQSAYCEMTVTISHCDSVGAKTQVFKVQGFKNLPQLCEQVTGFICEEMNCLQPELVYKALRVLANEDQAL